MIWVGTDSEKMNCNNFLFPPTRELSGDSSSPPRDVLSLQPLQEISPQLSLNLPRDRKLITSEDRLTAVALHFF